MHRWRLQLRLLLPLLAREVRERAQHGWLGAAWPFIAPIATASVLTFVFGVIFQSRWGTQSSSGLLPLALNLYVGLIIFQYLAESITASPAWITRHAALSRQGHAPVLKLVAASWANHSLTLGGNLVLLSAIVLLSGNFEWGLLPTAPVWLGAALLPLLLSTLSLVLALAALGVYLRNLGPFLTPATQLLLFLSPVFYPADQVPQGFRWLLQCNPLVWPVETIRHALLGGPAPEHGLIAMWLPALLLPVALWLFQRLRQGFADVL